MSEENGADGNTSYNVEMQGENQGNLPKRSRYHQAQMDVTSLHPGADFNELNASYVVFICTFDPFGRGLYRYTFENQCKELSFPLEDGATKVFLNTKGKNADEVPTELIHFLKYIETSTCECAERIKDSIVARLHKRVETLKKSGEWERRYMTLEEMLREEKKAGYAEGRAEGVTAGAAQNQQRMFTLIRKMASAGEKEMLPMLTDTVFLQEMYKKYQV